MPAMLTPYRIISPILATAMVVLPVSQAQAAAFAPAAQPVEGAPADAAAPSVDAPSIDAAPVEGADDAPAEGAEGAPVEGAEGAPAEGAEGAPLEPVPPAEPEPEPVAEPEPEPILEIASVPIDSDRPKEPTIAGKPAKGKGMLIAGGVLFGAGVVGTVTSVLLTRCPEPANTVGCKYEEHRFFAVPIATSGALVGVLLLGVGLGFNIRYKKWMNWKSGDKKAFKESALVPTFSPGGAGLGYIGRF